MEFYNSITEIEQSMNIYIFKHVLINKQQMIIVKHFSQEF